MPRRLHRLGSCRGTTISYCHTPIARGSLEIVPVARIVTKNALVHATILVDGFAAGTWQLEKGRVRLEPFSRLARETAASLRLEAERVEAFVNGSEARRAEMPEGAT